MGIVAILIAVGILAAVIVSSWKLYEKAGQPGWAAIVPIYNIIVLMKIIKRPGWWVLLFLVPIVSFVISVIVCLDLAKAFGKGTGFAAGLVLLGPVFWMILGFGDAQYVYNQEDDLSLDRI